MIVNKIAADAFDNVVAGAGVILTNFNPTTPSITDADILFATTGGIKATAKPTFKDWGEDVDNCPKNTKEMKKLDSWECKLAGTAATVTLAAMTKLGGASDAATGKTTLRNALKDADFSDLWWVGEKTKDNVVAYVHLSNALSTGGIDIQTTDKDKGKFAFEFTGHYAIASQDAVPFEYGEITATT